MQRIHRRVYAAAVAHLFDHAAAIVADYAATARGTCYVSALGGYFTEIENIRCILSRASDSIVWLNCHGHVGISVTNRPGTDTYHVLQLMMNRTCSICSGRSIGAIVHTASGGQVDFCRYCWNDPGAIEWIGSLYNDDDHAAGHWLETSELMQIPPNWYASMIDQPKSCSFKGCRWTNSACLSCSCYLSVHIPPCWAPSVVRFH